MSLFITKPNFGLIGHRGVAAHAPENTLAGIRLAKLMNLDWVEIDVRMTRDHHLVIIHDESIARTTNGLGHINELTLEYLEQFDAGAWFSNDYAEEKIPSLAQALDLILSLDLKVNLEIKCENDVNENYLLNFARRLTQELAVHWPAHAPPVLVSSFNHPFIHYYREMNPEKPVGLLTNEIHDHLIDSANSMNNCAIHCNYKFLNEEIMAKVVKHDIPMLVYTVNDPAIGNQLLEQGAFGVFCDSPTPYQST